MAFCVRLVVVDFVSISWSNSLLTFIQFKIFFCAKEDSESQATRTTCESIARQIKWMSLNESNFYIRDDMRWDHEMNQEIRLTDWRRLQVTQKVIIAEMYVDCYDI